MMHAKVPFCLRSVYFFVSLSFVTNLSPDSLVHPGAFWLKTQLICAEAMAREAIIRVALKEDTILQVTSVIFIKSQTLINLKSKCFEFRIEMQRTKRTRTCGLRRLLLKYLRTYCCCASEAVINMTPSCQRQYAHLESREGQYFTIITMSKGWMEVPYL